MSITIDELKKTGAKPNYFGLGFIQLKLNETTRIHFWNIDLPGIVAEEDLHDHRYDFKSEILYGSLYQEIWQHKENYYGTHEMFTVSCDSERPMDPVFIKAVDVTCVFSCELKSGSSYYANANTFHRAKPTAYAVTKLTRSSPNKIYAKVIRPKNTPHICPFSVKYSDNELWDRIESMLK